MARVKIRTKKPSRVQAQPPPLLARVFKPDYNHTGGFAPLYDACSFAWAVVSDADSLGWKQIHPMELRCYLSPHIPSIQGVYKALITLAVHTGTAFTVTQEDITDSSKKYPLVIVPKGDLRAAPLVRDATHVIEDESMPKHKALVFDNGTPEENGLLLIHTDITGAVSYGIAVWRPFYLLELVTAGYTAHKRIPI